MIRITSGLKCTRCGSETLKDVIAVENVLTYLENVTHVCPKCGKLHMLSARIEVLSHGLSDEYVDKLPDEYVSDNDGNVVKEKVDDWGNKIVKDLEYNRFRDKDGKNKDYEK